MLMQALESDRWPGKAKFAVTPGGFVKATFPSNYNGERGWKSRPRDFKKLIPHAEKSLRAIVTKEVLQCACRCVHFLTIGMDLNNDGGKLQITEGPLGTHAELVAVVNTKTCDIHWTGKSYPKGPPRSQENTLVQEANLKSHFFRLGKEYVLILGCHDLHMFGARSRANQRSNSLRHKRCTEMRRLANKYRPTIILQHPHCTDHPQIWGPPWSGARKYLRSGRHIWAAGIAYCNLYGEEPRGDLDKVLKSTGCCNTHVLDVFVNGY